MYIDENLKLNFSYKIFSIAILTSIALFFLNEFIFFTPSLAFLINISIFFIASALILNKNSLGFFILYFASTAFYTRPRFLHLIDIDSRGAYDFFSFNSQQFGPFVFSTSLLFLITIYYLFRNIYYDQKIDIKPLYPVLIFTLLGLVSMISFILEGNNIYASDFISDFKNVVFLFGGYFYGIEIYKKYREKFLFDFVNFLLFLFIVNGFFGFINISYDFLQKFYQLQYGIMTYSIAPIFFLIFLLKTKSNFPIFIYSLIIFCSISLWPFTRGEQLNVIILLLITAFFVIRVLTISIFFKRMLIFFIALNAFIILDIQTFIFDNLDTSVNYYLNKVSLFLEGKIDKSVNVRLSEFKAIFAFNNSFDFYQFFFGNGLGSYFRFDITTLHGLDFADFSRTELLNNRFTQPHSFLSYFFLKAGMIGLLSVIYFYTQYLKIRLSDFTEIKSLTKILYLLFLFSFLWNGYWIPFICFLSAFFVAILYSIEESHA